jgi:hypothetical protein
MRFTVAAQSGVDAVLHFLGGYGMQQDGGADPLGAFLKVTLAGG